MITIDGTIKKVKANEYVAKCDVEYALSEIYRIYNLAGSISTNSAKATEHFETDTKILKEKLKEYEK
jgi:CRISPR/Cas system type I-B associated protein Csh2 (Cas7 group RAMP superfamily)